MKENAFISTREFLQRVIDVCLDFLNESNDRSSKVLKFLQPDELMKKFDFGLGENPHNLESIVQDCAAALYYQVRTGKLTPHNPDVVLTSGSPNQGRHISIIARIWIWYQFIITAHWAHKLPNGINNQWSVSRNSEGTRTSESLQTAVDFWGPKSNIPNVTHRLLLCPPLTLWQSPLVIN